MLNYLKSYTPKYIEGPYLNAFWDAEFKDLIINGTEEDINNHLKTDNTKLKARFVLWAPKGTEIKIVSFKEPIEKRKEFVIQLELDYSNTTKDPDKLREMIPLTYEIKNPKTKNHYRRKEIKFLRKATLWPPKLQTGYKAQQIHTTGIDLEIDLKTEDYKKLLVKYPEKIKPKNISMPEHASNVIWKAVTGDQTSGSPKTKTKVTVSSGG